MSNENRPLVGTVLALATVASCVLSVLSPPSAEGDQQPLPYALNADRRQDLVLGLPDWIAPSGDALGLLVAPGRRARLLGRAKIFTSEDLDPGLGRFDQVGMALASGDFDGDGFSDLAVGVPSFVPAPEEHRGGVLVIYGAREFPGDRRQLIPGLAPDTENHGTLFGEALTAGDLNNDGYSDLVVGARKEDQQNTNRAFTPSGAIHVLLGGAAGIDTSTSWRISRAKRTYPNFGRTLALGDVNGDGHLDLVEADRGLPDDRELGRVPGHLSIALGGRDGPRRAVPVPHDFRGGPTSLAIGDVTGDGYDDVVAGVPINSYDKLGEVRAPGVVLLWRGRASGLADKPIAIDQASPHIPGTNERADDFGKSVLVARVDKDRFADIIVGAPGENSNRGRVTIIRGSAKGYARHGHMIIRAKRQTEIFGYQMSLLDFNGDGRRDLAVGHWPARVDAGTYTVFRGVRRGFSRRRTKNLNLAKRELDRDDADAAYLARDGSS